ncbi:hypothetical protein BaRGS_00007224 [Batillaria attramentaria]|uniref:Uncharacterized protein n=1 Tax=Batillaria attramentaria TaxID=370345 RepID=A0ABD0LQC6_9CAEN
MRFDKWRFHAGQIWFHPHEYNIHSCFAETTQETRSPDHDLSTSKGSAGQVFTPCSIQVSLAHIGVLSYRTVMNLVIVVNTPGKRNTPGFLSVITVYHHLLLAKNLQSLNTVTGGPKPVLHRIPHVDLTAERVLNVFRTNTHSQRTPARGLAPD